MSTEIAPDDGSATSRIRPRRVSPGDVIGFIVVFGCFIGAWYFMSYWGLRHIFDKPGRLITPPHQVIDDSYLTWRFLGPQLQGLRWTATAALIGLLISIVLGMAIAIAMAQARWLERSVWPYLIAVQAVPILAVVPVIAAVFGYGLNARILVCVIISLFPIVSNTLFGLLSAETGQHDLFTLHGVSRWTRLTKLQLPAAMPAVFTGFRISAGLSVVGAVVGEQFFVRGDKGLGILMTVYRSRGETSLMYGALVLSALLGIVVFVVFAWINELVVGKWHESTRSPT